MNNSRSQGGATATKSWVKPSWIQVRRNLKVSVVSRWLLKKTWAARKGSHNSLRQGQAKRKLRLLCMGKVSLRSRIRWLALRREMIKTCPTVSWVWCPSPIHNKVAWRSQPPALALLQWSQNLPPGSTVRLSKTLSSGISPWLTLVWLQTC